MIEVRVADPEGRLNQADHHRTRSFREKTERLISRPSGTGIVFLYQNQALRTWLLSRCPSGTGIVFLYPNQALRTWLLSRCPCLLRLAIPREAKVAP
jgi:hypothetical protein